MAMNLFEKAIRDYEEALKNGTTGVNKEEWVWVEGYKGTDKDMKCRDYQYELGKQFDMPEGAEIDLCNSGFHFCKKLEDVFGYYDIKDGNRFFKVHALVRKGKESKPTRGLFYFPTMRDTKETSKSIVFIEELGTEEIFASCSKEDAKLLNAEEKEQARTCGIAKVLRTAQINDLKRKGYVESMAELIIDDFNAYKQACALADQTNISMDARIVALFSNN